MGVSNFTPSLRGGVKSKTAGRRGCSPTTLHVLHLLKGGVKHNKAWRENGAFSYSHTSRVRGVNCVKRLALMRFRVANGCEIACKLYRGCAA